MTTEEIAKTPIETTTAATQADGPFPLITTPKKMVGDDKDPFVYAATDMSLVHNVIIRGLNSIYLQAPNITAPKDKADFVGYAKCWSGFLHAHHEGEEAKYFPAVEAKTGVKDIMEPNIEQHKAFSAGLMAFDEYLSSIDPKKPEEFDGKRLNEIIDTFATPLTQHLADEIPTLLSLKEYGSEKVDIKKISNDEAEYVMRKIPITLELSFFIVNLHMDYEDGLHKDFPPAPALIIFVLRHLCTLWNRKYWRFAPCDKYGKRKELLFAV